MVFAKHLEKSQVFGKNHTCVVFTKHLDMSNVFGKKHICVVFTKHLDRGGEGSNVVRFFSLQKSIHFCGGKNVFLVWKQMALLKYYISGQYCHHNVKDDLVTQYLHFLMLRSCHFYPAEVGIGNRCLRILFWAQVLPCFLQAFNVSAGPGDIDANTERVTFSPGVSNLPANFFFIKFPKLAMLFPELS